MNWGKQQVVRAIPLGNKCSSIGCYPSPRWTSYITQARGSFVRALFSQVETEMSSPSRHLGWRPHGIDVRGGERVQVEAASPVRKEQGQKIPLPRDAAHFDWQWILDLSWDKRNTSLRCLWSSSNAMSLHRMQLGWNIGSLCGIRPVCTEHTQFVWNTGSSHILHN